MRHGIAWLFVAFSVSAWSQPQKDLCDGIGTRSETKIVDSILSGASLGELCGSSLPLHIALSRFPQIVALLLQVGVDAGALDNNGNTTIALAADKGSPEIITALLRQRFFALPRFDERDGEADEGFVLLGKSPRSALPLYLLEEQKHQAGWLLWGEKIFDLAENQAPPASLIRRAASMLNRWGQIAKIDWHALDQMTNPKSVKANLALLIRKRNFIVDFAYVLQEIKRLDDKQEQLDVPLRQAIHDQAAIARYIDYTQDQIVKRERPKVHAALETIAHVLGVNTLPDTYRDAVTLLISRDSHFAELFVLVAEQAAHANHDLDEVKLQTAQLALNSTVQQSMMRIAGLREAGFQVYQKAAIILLKALQMTASLMNTQFATDSFLSLVHDASSNDPRLERADINEASLNALVNFNVDQINPKLTTDELRTIYEIGPVGLAELRAHLTAARKRAPNWTTPQEGLGTLLHGGWTKVTLPAKREASIFKATRTVAMARGLNLVFEEVDLDFSKLGVMSRENAAELLAFVQELLDNNRADAEATYDRLLAKTFSPDEKALVLAVSTTFVANLNNTMFAIHSRLRELKPKF